MMVSGTDGEWVRLMTAFGYRLLMHYSRRSYNFFIRGNLPLGLRGTGTFGMLAGNFIAARNSRVTLYMVPTIDC